MMYLNVERKDEEVAEVISGHSSNDRLIREKEYRKAIPPPPRRINFRKR